MTILPFLSLSRTNHWSQTIYGCRDHCYYAYGDLVLFSKFCFLNYLFQQIWQHEQDFEWEWCLARYWIQWLLARNSSTQLYEWVIHCITCSPWSSQYSLPYVTSSSFPSSWPLPIPPPSQQSPTPHIPIQTSPTITKTCWCQWRRDFLCEEFPEDPVKGSQENPIMIDVSDFKDWSSVSINVREVMLWFYTCSPLFFLLFVSSLPVDTHFTPSPYPFFIQVLSLSMIHVLSLVQVGAAMCSLSLFSFLLVSVIFILLTCI